MPNISTLHPILYICSSGPHTCTSEYLPVIGLVVLSCLLHSYCVLFSEAYSPLQISQLI